MQFIPAGTYYARAKVGGKSIRVSPDTDVYSTARLRLPDKLKELRKPVAEVGTFGQGRIKYEAETRNGYTSKKKRLIKLAPLSITGELLPESETRFFERMSAMPFTGSRNDEGEVTRLTVEFSGETFSYKKISKQPPKGYEPPKPPVIVHLDTNVLDACLGDYEFSTGIKATMWRNGDQMLWQVRGKKVIPGPFSVYPESETNFYLKLSGGQLIFIKNEKGEVTAVNVHDPWMPDGVGKKTKNE
ncbi:hypothetical protein SBV1_130100 [Verrucomicrobia bacterium]|nr:hypothetical protein SBV1_130100 [Verrucomicrobiota bacterium]